MSKTSDSNNSISYKYIEALQTIKGWTTVSDWAIKVGELFPELLEKANQEAKNHKRPSTGIREIAARISSAISTGRFAGQIEVDESDRPKRVRIINETDIAKYQKMELESDLEPLSRAQKLKSDYDSLGVKEKYRLEEFESIISQLKSYFNLDFELEHAQAILNPIDPGKHHPNNVQILLKSHNRSKGNNNWARFTLDEQVEYIKAAIRIQKLVSKKMNIEIQEDVIDSILERLKSIY